ncbi:acetylornithine transaminase [Peribacillus alkalitolerans]|uniref:acetylornithine transaminase n=1 Tax=Peribacillus alkalitolerans TaxID=1550385 RepID=UPI0013D59037|nr:acetylornithine transaminase [Peribacillus alkalitolerans]
MNQALFPTYQRWDIRPKKGIGSWLYSEAGKEYLDFTSGIGVTSLGHCNPEVTKAVYDQLEQYWHTSNLFTLTIQEQVARHLTEVSQLNHVFFCNSGAEANEAAIKLAKKATGRKKIISCLGSFHGRTYATMGATGQEKVRVGYGPMLEEFDYIPFNDVKSVSEKIDGNTAAIMLEVVQGEGGIHPVSQEYLTEIQEVAKKNGTLIIVDEIQTGIGRTGTAFAYQHFDISPDIITVAKALGNGLPIGAMIGKAELEGYFGPGSHGSTFGGNPVSLAACKATLDIIFQPDFLELVGEKGHYLKSQLQKKLANSKHVKNIRGMGLMIGIEIDCEANPFLMQLQQEGILTLLAGPNVLRLLPPLTVTQQEMDIAIKRICQTINS